MEVILLQASRDGDNGNHLFFSCYMLFLVVSRCVWKMEISAFYLPKNFGIHKPYIHVTHYHPVQG